MVSSIVTALQLFGIGVSLGLGTQCLFACAPILLSYVAAVEHNWKRALWDVLLLVGGRLVGYAVLGALVGISIGYIERVISSNVVSIIKLLIGWLIIFFGLSIALGLSLKIDACAYLARHRFSKGGLFLVGVAIGLAPCLPLILVMSEISLISKSAFSGAVYALFFGLGTALATFITIGPIAGVLGQLPSRILKSNSTQRLFRVTCGALLALFGIIFIKSVRL